MAISPEAVGAFLSGVGSVIGGIYAMRAVRARGERDCQRRIDEMREEFDRGLERGLHLHDDEEHPE